MIFKRKIYDKLLEWKQECHGEKAILIKGAKGIGKSTIVEEFAKNEYKSYLMIDFSRDRENIKKYFIDYGNDFDTLFLMLSTYYGVDLFLRESLIIFDEVQMFPQARALIKFLVKDGRYDYIETGSLISIKENVKDIVIPSEERHINMYPLDFEEFLWASENKILIKYIKDCFGKKQPLERQLHNKAMMLFKEYMLVGGMPKPLSKYIEGHKNFKEADNEKRGILTLYREDIMKIHSLYREKVLSIYDYIPGLLSQHEKRVVFNDITQGSQASQYEETFFWLSDSMICNECFMCNDPNVGLSLNEKRTYIKCYMGDTGLLITHAFSENNKTNHEVYKQLLFHKININEGIIMENIVAQMLRANDHKLYFYSRHSTKKDERMKIDFLISKGNKIKMKVSPIEVKSSKNYTYTLLNKFQSKYSQKIGQRYILHTKDIQQVDDILLLPIYMTLLI